MYSFVEKYSCIYQHRYYIYACVCVCVCIYIYNLKFLQIWLNYSIKVDIYVTFSFNQMAIEMKFLNGYIMSFLHGL